MDLRVVILCLLLWPVQTVGASEPPDFARDVLPILSKHCFACHGPDEATREGGLRLDVRQHAIAVLDSGSRAIVPNSPDESEFVVRIEADDEFLQMPPPETGKSLATAEKRILRHWIESGADYAAHWAFEPIQRPPIPHVASRNWGRNEIDRFVLARLEAAELGPSPEAAPETLIRRLYLDLIGLPPAYDVVRRYADDPSEAAYERIVDQLLTSDHFGERWGRHWLDLARYADSNGYLGDELRPDAWRYRDWVIQAINDDLPYDQFTIEQIAGDLLEDATSSQRIATGFHRNAMENTEAGVDKESDRVVRTVDRLSTFGTIWMGMTVGCAECHTHKFDPITHHEFYQLYAFFNNLEPDKVILGYREPEDEASKEAVERERQIDRIVNDLRQQEELRGAAQDMLFQQHLQTLATPEKRRSEEEKESLEHWRADLSDASKSLLQRYEDLAGKRPTPTEIAAPAMSERRRRRSTFVHYRGDFRQPTDQVEANTPTFLPPLNPRKGAADRLDLARWLVRPDHPLTARTAANHIWQHLFQEGLFRTEENLGVAGQPPTHPQLLDWLAAELQANGWSRKRLIKKIVLSATYRQSSRQTELLRQQDPENRLWGRQNRYRLEAEIIRDAALATSGLLHPEIGGPSIRPPMDKRLASVSRNQDWDVTSGERKYRRGMYILFRRATPFPMLTTFDSPDSTSSCAAREISNSPLQSLTLLNDPVFFECAQNVGRDGLPPKKGDDDAWLVETFRQVLARDPNRAEMERSREFYHDLRQSLQASEKSELKAIVAAPQKGTPLDQQAARVLFARGLMNLDEFITRE